MWLSDSTPLRFLILRSFSALLTFLSESTLLFRLSVTQSNTSQKPVCARNVQSLIKTSRQAWKVSSIWQESVEKNLTGHFIFFQMGYVVSRCSWCYNMIRLGMFQAKACNGKWTTVTWRQGYLRTVEIREQIWWVVVWVVSKSLKQQINQIRSICMQSWPSAYLYQVTG